MMQAVRQKNTRQLVSDQDVVHLMTDAARHVALLVGVGQNNHGRAWGEEPRPMDRLKTILAGNIEVQQYYVEGIGAGMIGIQFHPVYARPAKADAKRLLGRLEHGLDVARLSL